MKRLLLANSRRGKNRKTRSGSPKPPPIHPSDLGLHSISVGKTPPVPKDDGPSRRKILVVDGDPEAAGIVALMCGILEYQAVIATSVEKALILTRMNDFNLVLINYYLPPSNGLLLLNKIRQLGQHMPAIMMTAFPDIAKFMRPAVLNVAHVLIKPLTLASLKKALDESIGK